ncbi:SCO family protein [Pusillimonas sp.]|uniref:SCO family protein n=1 Tax=Pusillimonas sp. TaxID=3040095 RepID=UPI0037CBDA46
MRWVLALIFALLAGAGPLYGLTDGFSAVTAESARRQDVARQPRAIGDALVTSANNGASSLREELQADGRVAIVNFFYTRCISLCLAQGFVTQRLQAAIEAQGLQTHIQLLSISFDARDKGPDLSRYALSMRADPAMWRFWSFEQSRQRDALLRQFGITVIPALFGDYEHNAALHVVTPDGRLAGIFDLEEPGLALGLAKKLASEKDQP